ncbi:MAG: HAD family hydrolase [Bacteroidia bacterium]
MLKYKAIIFDLGGVIVNLDQDRTIRSFKRLNIDLEEVNEKLPVFKQYETGKVNTETFIQTIKSELKGNASNIEISTAWNKMILDVPIDRIEVLKELRKHYKLYILSNTNELHIQEFNKLFEIDHPNENWEDLFDKIYYSHQIGLRKPNEEAWQLILDENKIQASETIFIDDTSMHFKAANSIGIKSFWAKEPIGQWFIEEVKNLENLEAV